LVLGSFKSLEIKEPLVPVFFENFRISEPPVQVLLIFSEEPLDLGSPKFSKDGGSHEKNWWFRVCSLTQFFDILETWLRVQTSYKIF